VGKKTNKKALWGTVLFLSTGGHLTVAKSLFLQNCQAPTAYLVVVGGFEPPTSAL
jgi:hypothetical protein